MSEIESFAPPWWLNNRHFQSCYASLLAYRANTILCWEELILPDNDFIDIAWAGDQDGDIVVLMHGLEGSVKSYYMQMTIDRLVQQGKHVVVMHYRTCSGRINRYPHSYNGMETKDLAFLLAVLAQRHPLKPISIVGFSLGGNLLLQYCADYPDAAIDKVIAVSTPFDLSMSADHLSPFYQRYLLNPMKRKIAYKLKKGYAMPVQLSRLKKISTLREFDDLITAPLAGFDGVDNYYYAASCRRRLPEIRHNTHIIHAKDDPFVPEKSIPRPSELPSNITLELLDRGGHVGFIRGGTPWNPDSWLIQRLGSFFEPKRS